jgi:putative aldouronate transport system substrate-binding protein
MIKKKLTLTLTLVLAFAMVLSACGGGNNNGKNNSSTPSSSPSNSAESTSNAKEELERVNLIWHYVGPAQPDIKAVNDKVNEYLIEKINATVELRAGEWDFEQKMNPRVAASEEFDLVWTSNWHFNYAQNVRRGAFIPLDELIEKYAPAIKDVLPEIAFEAMKVDGQIYAIPNYQTFANREGFFVRESVLEAFPLDINSVKKVEDMEPYFNTLLNGDLDAVAKGYFEKNGKDSSVIETKPYMGSRYEHFQYYYGQEEAGVALAAIYKDDASLKVVNKYETPEYEQHMKLARDWYLKGFIHPDAAIETPKHVFMAAHSYNVLKPGGDVNNNMNGGHENVDYVPLTDAYISNGAPSKTATAISRTSKNPERAMMLLELMNTDKYLFNLIAYGIEGKHYEKIDDTFIRKLPDSKYNHGASWVFGNTFLEYLLEGMPATLHQETIDQNENATPSVIMGFVFNPEPVQTEIANVNSVIGEYQKGLNAGAIDVDKYLPELRERLKKAGSEKVITEVQKQLDAWKASK